MKAYEVDIARPSTAPHWRMQTNIFHGIDGKTNVDGWGASDESTNLFKPWLIADNFK